MRNKFRFCLSTVMAVALAITSQAFADTTITILHNNDTHAHIVPFDDANHGTNCGGAVRRAGLIELIKKEVKEPLLLDAGDISQGTTFFTLFRGEASFSVAKQLGYSATTMGNHELDLGIERTLEVLDKTGMRLLSCNVKWPDNRYVFEPFAVFVRNGLKIAVIGRTGSDAWGDCNIKETNKMKLLDPIESVRATAKRIRPYVDLIAVISHSEVAQDRLLAASVSEVDIVVGGHTHEIVRKPELIKHNDKAGDYDNGLGGTLFTEAGEWGHYLGRVDITVDEKTKKITKYDGELIEVRPEHEQFAPKAIKDLVDYYDQSRLKQIGRVIGHTAKEIEYNKDLRWKKMLPACIFTCEAMRYASKGDIGLINARGVRANIPEGDITVGDIHTMLPFENTVVVVTLKGSDVQKMFDYLAQNYGHLDAYETAGVTADMYVEEGKAKNIKINGEPLDENKEYRVSTGSFIADGNLGADVFFANPVSIFDTGIVMRDAQIAYTEHVKEVPDFDYQPLNFIKAKSNK